MIEGVPAQVIVEPGEALGALPVVAANAEAVLGEIERLTSRGFDVTQAPPIRAELIEVDEEDHVLTVVVHHILRRRILDGTVGVRRDERVLGKASR